MWFKRPDFVKPNLKQNWDFTVYRKEDLNQSWYKWHNNEEYTNSSFSMDENAIEKVYVTMNMAWIREKDDKDLKDMQNYLE